MGNGKWGMCGRHNQRHHHGHRTHFAAAQPPPNNICKALTTAVIKMHEAVGRQKNCNCDKMRECVCVSGGHMNMEIFWHDCLADAGELQNAQALELIAEHMAYA